MYYPAFFLKVLSENLLNAHVAKNAAIARQKGKKRPSELNLPPLIKNGVLPINSITRTINGNRQPMIQPRIAREALQDETGVQKTTDSLCSAFHRCSTQ